MPSTGRRTCPYCTRSLMTALAALMGMAKPMPALCPTELRIRVLMPMTSPWEFNSGPPELPGLMGASVWMASSMMAPPSGSRTERIELTMPRVMVPFRPKGLPMAKTFCPTCSPRESPRTAGVSSPGVLIWITARSWDLSSPTISAEYFLRFDSVTSRRRGLSPMTCWLVRMCPCLSMMKPEPWPCCGTRP